MCEQVFGHVVGLCFDLGFGHHRAERIPAVPAHRRRSRPFPEGRGGFGMGIGICGKTALVEAPNRLDASVAISARDFIDGTDGRFLVQCKSLGTTPPLPPNVSS